MYDAPVWLPWTLAGVGFAVAASLTYHDLRATHNRTLKSVDPASLLANVTSLTATQLFAIQEISPEFVGGFWVRDEHGGGQGKVLDAMQQRTAKAEGRLIYRADIAITAIPSKRVEHIELDVIGRRIPAHEWRSVRVDTTDITYADFNVPEWVNRGVLRLKLIATVEGEERESPVFEVEFP